MKEPRRFVAMPSQAPSSHGSRRPQLPSRDRERWTTAGWRRRYGNACKRYPLKAAADRVTGQVLVAAVVQADGAIAEVRITESSGFPLLDEAAVEAVRNASPLALLRSLDHAQVSVEIPITYHGHN